MKIIIRIILFSISLFFSTFPLFSDWIQCNGPFNSEIHCFATLETNIFAGSGGGGIYLSTNNGKSWKSASDSFLSLNVKALRTIGTNILAGTTDGIFLSTNNGKSWIKKNNGLSNLNITSLAVTGSKIFAGTYKKGIFLTLDSGNSWNPINDFLTDSCIYAISADDYNIYAGTNRGIIISRDFGKNWIKANVDNSIYSRVRDFAFSGTKIFAATYGLGVFMSSDLGLNWSPVNSGLTNPNINSLFAVNSSLYAASWGGGVFLSTNEGISWNEVNYGITDKNIYTLVSSGKLLFIGVRNGVFSSIDSGKNWDPYLNLNATVVNSLMIYGKSIFAGTQYGGINKSTNNGESWSLMNTGLTNTSIRSIVVLDSILFCGTEEGIFRSFDKGKNWELGSPGTKKNYIITIDIHKKNLYYGTYKNSYISSDHGSTWIQIYNLMGIDVSSFLWNDSLFFAGTWGYGIIQSTDDGKSWVGKNAGIESQWVNSIAICGNNIFGGFQSDDTHIGGVYVSNTWGDIWSIANTGLTNIFINSLIFYDKNLFAGTKAGVFLSTNFGTNWSSMGLSNMNILSFSISNNNIYVGTQGGGILRRPISEMITDVEQQSLDLDKNFTLNQNYPNPVSRSTTISFSIPKDGYTSLKIFNILGEEVATLVSKELPAGTHNVRWNASSLPTGIYFYCLESGMFRELKKLVLSR